MHRSDFLELLNERVLIADGAMGTMIYEKGVFVNTCFDELNLTRAALIGEIHRAYISAGCDIIETNTFGANRLKLSRFGLADRVKDINTAAAQIARRAAGESQNKVLIAGAIGPLGCEIAQSGRISEQKAGEYFAEQAETLDSAGVDLFILETFSSMFELLEAISAVSTVSKNPIIAQMSTEDEGATVYGRNIEDAIERVSREQAVDVVGLNCSLGPSGMLDMLKKAASVSHKPISVLPNAGMPREIEGRRIYMCTPEYMAEYAKRCFEHGARIIGGCCGTTPEHIEQVVRAVGSLDRAMARKTRISAAVAEPQKAEMGCETVPLALRSKLGAKLDAGEMISAIEVTPPKGTNFDSLIEKAKLCADCGIDAINIPDGPRASSRLSPMVTAVKIHEAADIETILHICCRDRNIIGMQSDMLGADALGLHNVLLVTGDPPKLGEFPDATGVFDLDSVALTAVVERLNRGIDIAGYEFSPPLSMTIGVGANPAASDMHREIDRFRAKAAAGAEYAITQPVFDTEMFYAFQAAVQDCGIPLIAGIWPFTSYKNAEFMANEVPGVVVTQKLLERMKQADTKEKGRELGIEIAREMMAEIEPHIAGFAVSAPFGNVRIPLAALGKIEISEI